MSERALAQTVNATGVVVFLAFLFLLLQPAIPNPFELEPVTAWVTLCYAFGAPIVLVYAARRRWWRPTPFDYLLAAYIGVVLATWQTSYDRTATGVAIVRLGAQIAVFCAIRLLAEHRPALSRFVAVALVLGIALLEWMATDFHLRYGLSERLQDYPALEWNGREGLGVVGAIQFALLIGLWQEARSRTVQVASILLIIGSVVEMLFLYSRLPWVMAAAVLAVALATSIRLGGFLRYFLAVGIIVSVVAVVATPFVVHLAKRAAGVEEGIESGPEHRLELIGNAPTIIRQHVFGGVGLGNYIAVHQRVFPVPYHFSAEPGPGHPHNLFVQQIAEVGIFGGLVYIALWASVLWAGWQISISGAPNRGAGMSLFYGLVAITVANLGENMFLDAVAKDRVRVHTVAWVLIAMTIAEWSRLRPSGSPSVEDVA